MGAETSADFMLGMEATGTGEGWTQGAETSADFRLGMEAITGGASGTLTSTLAALGTETSLTGQDDSTFVSTVATSATFTSVPALTTSTFTVLDTFFLGSVLLFFASTPPFVESSFTGSDAMGMIGGFAISFTGAE